MLVSDLSPEAVLHVRRDMHPDQIVMLSDSKDVIWMPCGRDLRRAFLTFKADIVLSCSWIQWPDKFKEQLFPDMPLLDADIPFPTVSAEEAYYKCKYINAGVVVGRAAALSHYIGGAFLRYGWLDSEKFDDQRSGPT